MLEKLTSLAKLDKKTANQSPTQFNAALPLKVEVLKRVDPLKYLLKIGNATLVTKSRNELEIGGKYWAMLQKSSTGTILISNLKKQPEFLEGLKNIELPKFDEIKEILAKKNPPSELKEFILEKMALSSSKGEFFIYSNMLLSLHNGVVTLPYLYEDRESFMQFKKNKKGAKGREMIDFYSIFPSLGVVGGVIYRDGEKVCATLEVNFENTKKQLEDEIDELDGFDRVVIFVKDEILPLYQFKDKMLDIRG